MHKPSSLAIRFASLLALFMTGASVSASPPASTSAPRIQPQNVTAAAASQDAREYKQIVEIYGQQDYDLVIQKADEFVARFPFSSQLAQVENLRGLSYLLTKRPLEAIDHFQRAIQKSPQGGSFTQFLLYNLAKAQFNAGQNEEADKTLARIQTETFDRENLTKFHFLKAGVLQKKGQYFDSAKELLAASRLQTSEQFQENRSSFRNQLDEVVKQIEETSSLQDLYLEYENSPLADQLLYRLAAREMTMGKPGLAEAHLRTLMAKYPSSSFVADANTLLKTSTDQSEVEPTAIGVLLPLKGKFARFGAKSLQAIELAFGTFDTGRPDNKITLVIQDTGDDPDQAIQGLNQLVTKHHVVGVIGPLLSKGIDVVTRRAEELGIPMLSLARHTGTSGQYIIHSGMTLQLQSYEIARQAIQKLGMKNFAILSPKDRIGQEASQHFWDAVELFGGKIVGMETYAPAETDFRQAVDKLSGLYYTEARQDELDELARLRRTNNIKKKTRKTEQYFNLKPIVDYQAVYMPDEAKIAAQIMPTFAYRDVDDMKFLGPAAWNTPELVNRAQNFAENAYFVDAYFGESSNPASRKFQESFQATFGEAPTAFEATAYDAAMILEQILRAGVDSRTELLEGLKEIHEYPGVTGRISFKDGHFTRDLKILRIKKGQITDGSIPAAPTE